MQTAVVEQGFSFHKIIKNRLRNSLKILTDNSLLRVKMLCSSPRQIDLDAAAQKYMVVPNVGPRSGLLLNDMHRKVSQVELGLLQEGVDDGELNFDLDFSRGEASDDDAPWAEESGDGDGAEEQEALQLSKAEEEGTGGAAEDDAAQFLGDIWFSNCCSTYVMLNTSNSVHGEGHPCMARSDFFCLALPEF